MGFLDYSARIIGAGATFILMKDVISTGHRRGLEHARADLGAHLTDVFIDQESTNTPSPYVARMKRWYKSFVMDSKIYSTYANIKNVITATFDRAARLVLPIGLALGALFTRTHNGSSKLLSGFMPRFAGIACAGFLIFEGARTFFGDVMGLFKRKHIE